MTILSIEEQIVTTDRLQKEVLSVFFTLTVAEGFDNPLFLRNQGFAFVNRVLHYQGSKPSYWFGVCKPPNDFVTGKDGHYHIHGFLGGIAGIENDQTLQSFWTRSARTRTGRAGIRKSKRVSLGQADFRPLTGNPYVFKYAVGQLQMTPCTNIQNLKPYAVSEQVAEECGEVMYVG
jgi:hypothetical protein